MSEVSTPGSFRKKKNSGGVVELPSGNFVRVRRPGMEKFLSAGFLPDPLAKEMTKMISTKSGRHQIERGSDQDIAQMMFEKLGGLQGVNNMIRVADKLAAYCIVEPPTAWHERTALDEEGKPALDDKGEPVLEDIPEQERKEDILYTDDIDLEDKMFLFQYCTGGSADLTQFRKATGAAVAVVPASGKVVEASQ
jgi:hypothetical protein